jgi:hypothetical protein
VSTLACAAGVLVARAKDSIDFLLRGAFFSFAPFFIVFGAQLFPVTGAVVQIALALLVFLAGEAARGVAARSRVAAVLLSNQLAFDAYYRSHPPRPFLYYVLYPLLFPYWLSSADARREFLLYKGYTLLSFLLLAVSLVVQYLRAFPPELGLHDFVPIAAGTLLAEAIVVLMFLMPIVTSVVHFHQRRAPRRLWALLLMAIVSLGFAAARLEHRRDPIVSFATRTRVRLRSAASAQAAKRAQAKALLAAWRALPEQTDDIDHDGKVEDLPLETARDALAGFYKNDEAHAFDLWYTKQATQAIMVLYFEAQRGHAPIWLAMDHRGTTTEDVRQLPTGAFKAMRHAAR